MAKGSTKKTVVQATAADLNMTEASAADIKTALQLIDNFISGSRGLVTEDNSAAIKTAVEIIDNFISGSRGLVTEDSAVAIKTQKFIPIEYHIHFAVLAEYAIGHTTNPHHLGQFCRFIRLNSVFMFLYGFLCSLTRFIEHFFEFVLCSILFINFLIININMLNRNILTIR